MTTRRFLAGVLCLLALSAPLIAQQAAELYGQGLLQEHANGRLEDAIALYVQAARAAGADRALAARALIRAAGAHEKLGHQAEAAAMYADVLRAYPEQRAEISVAQDRLRVLRRHVSAGAAAQGAKGVSVSSATAPVLERYCIRCHDARTRSGDLDLESLSEREVAENTGVWEQVVRRLLARREPPAGAPRPDEDTYRAVTARLQQALDAAYEANPRLKDADRVDDAELAGRLATLIWNAPPDSSLLADAKRGRLHEPVVLDGQVARMLRDPKSVSLVDGFLSGWLSLDNVKKARPDPSLYPQIDAELLQAMETETRLFLKSQLRDDRDAVEIWTANYTYLNARLARFYGVAGVTGQDFRRVIWPDDRRAGILGQAGLLISLSRSTRTSPTTRGRFVLSRFFGVDAPTPPANVPPLVERPVTTGTMRDRLLAHKTNPSCARCHSMFDPLGLALENFDAAGVWRTMDEGLPIDASGTFIDGTPFDGPAELRAGLMTYRDAYFTNLSQQLLSYALHRKGRGGQVYDYEMPAVRKIVRDTANARGRWSSLLAGVAASAPFQMKYPVP
ncbi:MAG TPA: DUF1592 domain-containing protein [Vicinamibacterales bacterium]|nr:DUF1592 domain-containing protein [Vicinamibacterales bacterium]